MVLKKTAPRRLIEGPFPQTPLLVTPFVLTAHLQHNSVNSSRSYAHINT
jgi:hypothetical protein